MSSPSMKTSGGAFGTALLNEMESVIGPSFKKVKSLCYREHKHGFYVYAKPNLRYGGLYARHRKTDSSLSHAIPKQKHRIYRSFNQWRTAILTSFGYDLWNVLHVGIKWSYLNSITTTNAYLSKNSMREPCPNLPESIPLHDFLWYNLPR